MSPATTRWFFRPVAALPGRVQRVPPRRELTTWCAIGHLGLAADCGVSVPGTRAAVRNDLRCVVRTGPHGLVESYLDRDGPRAAGVADRGAGPLRGPLPRRTGCSPAGRTGGCGRPEPARIMTCRSPTGSSSPSFTCGSSSRTRHWRSCTGCTGPRSPARSGRYARCWPRGVRRAWRARHPAAHPGRCVRLRVRPPVSRCGSTAPKCRSGAPGRASRGGGHSCRARRR
jgi:hypothetical protein